VNRAPAAAKINLALVVGPQRPDAKHEVATVYQRVDLADRVTVERAAALRIRGFAEDTLVRRALEALGGGFDARIEKRVPVAGGLGGGSSDAATALRLANALLDEPLAPGELESVARALGADVPFFLRPGPQLGRGDGGELEPLDLPQDYFVLLLAPAGFRKESTGDVYARFDARCGADGWEERVAALEAALGAVHRPRDLATLPPNDLASSPLADELRAHGAFRADVSGAGPVVYGLFHHRADADAAARHLRRRGRVWVTVPAWYF
jgi:4-diphosphocytidyl-2-C-methyl-D-erythritol kinase